ncbi:MAG: hypothetical protein PVJ83_05280, partial [Gammaproteobacteria bacterium]
MLETNEEGDANWIMGAAEEPAEAEPAATASEGAGSVPVIIEFAELRNIKLRYLAPGAAPFVASLDSLDISTGEEQYTVLDGKGEIDQLPLRLAGRLGPMRALEKGTGIGIDLRTVATSDDVAKILKRFQLDLPLSGALRIETALASVDAGMQVTVDASAGEISGNVAATRQEDRIRFKAAVPALDKVGKTFQVAGLPAQDLAVDGLVVLSSPTIRLHD